MHIYLWKLYFFISSTEFNPIPRWLRSYTLAAVSVSFLFPDHSSLPQFPAIAFSRKLRLEQQEGCCPLQPCVHFAVAGHSRPAYSYLATTSMFAWHSRLVQNQTPTQIFCLRLPISKLLPYGCPRQPGFKTNRGRAEGNSFYAGTLPNLDYRNSTDNISTGMNNINAIFLCTIFSPYFLKY